MTLYINGVDTMQSFRCNKGF